MDDGRIVELFLARDESALALAAEKYGSRLLSLAQNILGDPAPQLNLEALCEAIGATVRVCDPHNLKEFTQILKEETEADHVSVVIARRPCALLDKRKKEPAHIENCRNCGACMKIGCPALIKTDKGVVIDHTLCVGCGLCKQVCPFGAIQGGEE